LYSRGAHVKSLVGRRRGVLRNLGIQHLDRDDARLILITPRKHEDGIAGRGTIGSVDKGLLNIGRNGTTHSKCKTASKLSPLHVGKGSLVGTERLVTLHTEGGGLPGPEFH